MRTRGPVPIGVAVAVALLLWAVVGNKPAPAQADAVSVAAPATETVRPVVQPEVTVARSAVAASGASDTTLSKPHYLFEQLATAANAMAFAATAKARPDAGGYYYAVTVSRECLMYSKQREHSFGNGGAIPYDGSADQKMAQQRQRMLEEADRYCQGYTMDAYSEYLSPTVTDEGKRLKDPLLLARAALATTDVAKRKAAIEQSMAYPDPYLLYSNPELFFSSSSEGATYFDGQWQLARASQLVTAAQLASCDIGMSCGSNLLLLKWKCAIESECYGSLEEQVKSTWNVEALAYITAARARIVDAYRSGNAGIFVPPGR